MMTLTSCATKKTSYDFISLAHAAITLEMDIEEKDNHKLYIEAAEWIGTPYRAGGDTKKGTDCSGMVCSIYKKVFGKKLQRNSDDQRTKNCNKVSKSKLKEGDLVFFHTGKSKRTATHVGIYLKQDKFIHASNLQGVCVSSLTEPYWEKVWLQAGRVKGVKN